MSWRARIHERAPPIASLAIPPLPPTPWDSHCHPSAVMMGWWETRHSWTRIPPKFGRPCVDLSSSDFPAQDGWKKKVVATIWIIFRCGHHLKSQSLWWLIDSHAMSCSHPYNRGSMCSWVDESRRRSVFQPSDDCHWQKRDKFETVLLRSPPSCAPIPRCYKKSFFQAQSYLLPPSHRAQLPPLSLLLSIFYSPHPECSTISDSFPNILPPSFK